MNINSCCRAITASRIFGFTGILILTFLGLAACTSLEKTSQVRVSPSATITVSKTPTITVQAKETRETTQAVAATDEVEVDGTITIWHSWNEFEVESLHEVIAAFQEKNPEVQFDVLYVPFDDLRGKFEATATTGGGPNILIGAQDWGPKFYDSGLISDLTGQVHPDLIDEVIPIALESVQYKDAIIGLPQEINKSSVMFRNSAIISEAPATWKDLLEAAQAATQGDVVGADLETGLYFSAGYLNGCGGRLMDENGDPAFNNDAGVCWLKMLKEYAATGLPVENETENDVDLFKEGKVGLIVDGTWNTNALSEAIGAENLAIDPWPNTEQGALSGYVQTENLYLSANTTEDNKTASLAFIEFFMSPEAQATLAEAGKAAHIPAITRVEVTDPLMQQAVVASKGGIKFPILPEMNAYWEPLNTAIRSVLEGGADPAEALQKAEEDVITRIEEIRTGD